MLLLRVARAFDRARLPYALVGGFAVALHGAVRGTVDVDLVIRLREADFLESFRLLQGRAPSRSRLISLKVPEHLLDAFRGRCRLEGVKYQTQIKRLMSGWLRNTGGAQDTSD